MSTEVEVNVETGRCKYKGTDMEILCVETHFYVYLLKAVEECVGPPAQLFVYNLGKRHNKEMVKRYMGKHFWANLMMSIGRLVTPKMALEKSLYFARMTGFGRFDLVEFNSKKLVFRYTNSTIAQVYG